MQTRTMFRFLVALGLGLLLTSCGERGQDSVVETASAGPIMVAVANPHAAEAGMSILRRGGSAIDAAVAVQAVLGLVEPQSSGLGGGAFLLYYDAATGEVSAYDGREMAPRAVRPDHFLDADGRPRAFQDVVAGGQSVGVPGVVAMLDLAHQDHGILPWSGLFESAIAQADDGFEISPRLRFFTTLAPWTAQMPDTLAYFYDDAGEPLAAGTTLRNPAYAATLRTLAREGASTFYDGEIARAIVEGVQNAAVNPGAMTLDDMAAYEALQRNAICRPYRAYVVCGMPPPTSGGVTVQMILSLLEGFDLSALAPGSVEAVHLISEASRLAYADREMYLADADYVAVPVEGLLSATYLANRARLISTERSMGVAEAGDPWSDEALPRAPDLTPDVPGTSHFAIVDALGNAVSMTTSVESIFGSNVMVGGFFLNNQLTDFSFEPQRNGHPVANAPAPGKRPRSSMAPTIILTDEGELFALIGSAGGSRIPGYVVQTIIALIDWDMSMQEALDLPRHTNRNGAIDIEAGTALEALAPALLALGHQVRATRLNSGNHGIRIKDGVMDGGADPRREGVVLAD